MTILVTGARGHVGGAVLAGLLGGGNAVRASGRDPKSGDFPEGVEVVRADLTEPESFPNLLAGMRKVFLYARPEAPVAFVEAARDAGVEHVVLLSAYAVLFPDAERGNPIAAWHIKVERALERSGLDWTFIRPSYFATNTLRWRSIRTERVLRTAFPDASTPLVHERDIAMIAVRALTDDAHRRKAYPVLGARPLTVREQVTVIGEALEEAVRLDEIDVDTYRAELLGHLPGPLVDRLIEARGQVHQMTIEPGGDAVSEVLNRPPLTFSEWVRDHVDDFR